MAMTRIEYAAKQQVMKVLLKNGYRTYAMLLDKFDLNLTSDPSVIGYMDITKARIVLNKNLDINQVSVIVRHEILHEYLSHALRMERHVGKDKWANRTPQQHKLSNIAADYEISNRGYTEYDKEQVRNIVINGVSLSGLVTEDQHPEWVNMSLEDMYDELEKEQEKEKQEIENSGTPQIGDTGDQEKQEAEEIERQANAISNDAGESEEDDEDSKGSGVENTAGDNSDDGNEESDDEGSSSSDASSGSDDSDIESDKGETSANSGNQSDNSDQELSPNASKVKQAADNVADDADKLKDEIEDIVDDRNSDDEVFRDTEEVEQDKKIEARLTQLKKLLQDVQIADQIIKETETIVSKEKAVKAARDADKYKKSPLYRFKESLNNFIKNEIGIMREKTWSRVNKTYANTNIIKKGIRRGENVNIPRINVYFDRSGSWDDAKIAVGEQAIATLNNYVRRGELRIDLFYFSENVHSDKASAEREGGTRGEPILQHIKQTKPDNVIVMTDSDIRDCTSSVSVPGGVWFLFKGGYSENLVEHLKGKKLTRSFEI